MPPSEAGSSPDSAPHAASDREIGKATEADASSEQLFRYAQDLEELLRQHDRLQRRCRDLEQCLGRTGGEPDLIERWLRQSRRPLLITDAQGRLLRANRAARMLMQSPDPRYPAVGRLHDSVATEDQPQLERLLTTIDTQPRREALVLTTLCVHPTTAPAADATLVHCRVLVQVIYGADGPRLHWLLHPLTAGSETEPLVDCMPLESSPLSVMVTDPQTRILAVNDTACAATGFTQPELRHQLVGLLSSGRHPASFFHALWSRLNSQGGWRGEVLNRRKNGRIYAESKTIKAVTDERGSLLGYVSAGREVSDAGRDIDELARMAYIDPLTGLPNRRLLLDRMEQALKSARRSGKGLAVLFVDLDHFKPINDRLGHDTGDLVLKAAAQRLAGALRSEDTVARVGGDEFVMLLPDVSAPEAVAAVAQKLLDRLGQAIVVDSEPLFIGASVGSAIYPQDGEETEALLRHADTAMLAAKQQGRHQHCSRPAV